MNTKTAQKSHRMTRKEFFDESDRLLEEAQGFLADARKSRQEGEVIRAQNQRMMEALRKDYWFTPHLNENILNGQDALRKDNEILRQQLHHERELRECDIRELKTELRLHLSEALREKK